MGKNLSQKFIYDLERDVGERASITKLSSINNQVNTIVYNH